jgi:hypothetical protein
LQHPTILRTSWTTFWAPILKLDSTQKPYQVLYPSIIRPISRRNVVCTAAKTFTSRKRTRYASETQIPSNFSHLPLPTLVFRYTTLMSASGYLLGAVGEHLLGSVKKKKKKKRGMQFAGLVSIYRLPIRTLGVEPRTASHIQPHKNVNKLTVCSTPRPIQ